MLVLAVGRGKWLGGGPSSHCIATASHSESRRSSSWSPRPRGRLRPCRSPRTSESRAPAPLLLLLLSLRTSGLLHIQPPPKLQRRKRTLQPQQKDRGVPARRQRRGSRAQHEDHRRRAGQGVARQRRDVRGQRERHFDAPDEASVLALEHRVEAVLEDLFGGHIPVLARSMDEVAQLGQRIVKSATAVNVVLVKERLTQEQRGVSRRCPRTRTSSSCWTGNSCDTRPRR